jgi:beta-ureidopropionase / N-carbamoyl-L-amino-acid hydrolase
MSGNLPLDADRLWADVMALAAITEPDRPYTRRSFTPRFLEGRAFLAERFAAAGLKVRIDSAGNLIGRREGTDPAAGTIMIGSHSDTVPSGGRFDGIAGVVTALEIARAFDEARVPLRHALEVVDFLAEEPSDFGLSCVGSRGMVGRLGADHLTMTGPGGERLGSAIERMGGVPAQLAAARRDDVKAFFELHIEQGPVLETRAIDLGIVSSIVGITRLEIVFEGAADHAGTAPMDLRRDALVAAAETVVAIRRQAEALAGRGEGYFVATVGIVEVEPNASNVVPRRSRLVIDARTSHRPLIESFVASIDLASREAAAAARVERATFQRLSDTWPVACDEDLRRLLGTGAATFGFTCMDLASGAGHDAAFLAQVAPVAMVFVPCRDGKSHTPEEWADRDAIAAGAAVILEAVRLRDGASDSDA